jgi:hypothetical protein
MTTATSARRAAVAAAATLLLFASVADAESKRVAPWRKAAPARSVGGPCDLTIPGVWTGYFPGPLGDAYQLAWRGGLYPSGSFTAVFISGSPSWSLGYGQFSPDNSTVTIELDDSPGDVLHGNVSDGCATIDWDNGSSWRKTVNLPKRVHMIEMNHLGESKTTSACVCRWAWGVNVTHLRRLLPPPSLFFT